MKAWQIRGEYGIDKLQRVELPEPTAGDGQVVVSMRAASLNFRDLATIRGFPGAKAPAALVPFSDGAGIVQALGKGVSGLAVGDRVAPTFFQSWLDGPVIRRGAFARARRIARRRAAAAHRVARRRRDPHSANDELRRSGDAAVRGIDGVARRRGRGTGRLRATPFSCKAPAAYRSSRCSLRKRLARA